MFDVFDQSSWPNYNPDKALKNKLIGTIGNMIGLLNIFKNKIELSIADSFEYTLANQLKRNNPVAFNIMGIKIDYQDEYKNSILSSINQVLNLWKDNDNRDFNIFKIIELIKPFNKYLKNIKNHKSYEPDIELDFTSPKVTGNEAWNEYLAISKRNEDIIKINENYRSRLIHSNDNFEPDESDE